MRPEQWLLPFSSTFLVLFTTHAGCYWCHIGCLPPALSLVPAGFSRLLVGCRAVLGE